MDSSRFDRLSKVLACGGTRRSALGTLAATALGISAPLLAGHEADAKRKKKHHKKKGKPLGAICTPGKDKCKKGLKCDSPTTRHTCDSTVDDIDTWCCVPPGGKCTECDCCGDFYCGNDSTCVPNPEG
jgi:hypothetical protein